MKFLALFALAVTTISISHGTHMDDVRQLTKQLESKVNKSIDDATADLQKLGQEVLKAGKEIQSENPQDDKIKHCVDKNIQNASIIVKQFEAKILRFNRLTFALKESGENNKKCSSNCLKELSKKIKKKINSVPHKIDNTMAGAAKAMDKLKATMTKCADRKQ